MAVVKLSTSGLVNFAKYSSMRAGIPLPSLGSYDLLATEILTSSQASVTFSSLGDYAADYQHLQIRATARSTKTGDADDYLHMQFNANATNSYSWHTLNGTGSTVTSTAASSLSSIRAGNATLPGSSATANAFGGFVIDILDPFETSKNTTTRALTGVASSWSYLNLTSGAFYSTDALTEIKLFSIYLNLAQYSRFSLYGLKASA